MWSKSESGDQEAFTPRPRKQLWWGKNYWSGKPLFVGKWISLTRKRSMGAHKLQSIIRSILQLVWGLVGILVRIWARFPQVDYIPAAWQNFNPMGVDSTQIDAAQSLQPHLAVHLVGPLVTIWLAERDNPLFDKRVHLPTTLRLELARFQTAVRRLSNLGRSKSPIFFGYRSYPLATIRPISSMRPEPSSYS